VAFADSLEGKTGAGGPHRVGHWASLFLDYYFNYVGDTLSEASVLDVGEVVFELIPRKVSVEPEVAPELIAELRSFWEFLGREYRLPQAGAIIKLLSDQSILKLKNLLADPRNFGMAKTFFMQGQAAGFNMTTQEGLDQFMAVYNASISAQRGLPGLHTNDDTGSEFGPPDIGGDGVEKPTQSSASRKEKRKARKAQRQARKRNRR
jgi:hypothetical protein